MTAAAKPNVTSLYVMGFLTLLMGLIAVSAPLVAGTAIIFIVGILMLIAGIAQITSGLRAEGMSHKLLPLILGAVVSLGGISMLIHPIVGLQVLTLFIAAYFLAEGIWKIVASFNFRPAQGWLAVLFSGVITLALGALIWVQWPLSGEWAIGILVGVNLLMTGFAILALAATIGQTVDNIREDKTIDGHTA